MLAPKRVKYRKSQKNVIRGNETRGTKLDFGDYGMLALEPGRITARQIEAARVAVNRKMKRIGKLFIRIFPDHPVTKKPAETRMGKGKGAPEEWVAIIRPGRILYEVDGVDEALAREAFRLAGAKLPIRTRFVARSEEL